jgi:predicted permease
MNSFFRKLRWLVQRRDKEAELREELRFHLEEEAEQRQADGLAKDEARLAARRELGNLALVEENTRAAWGWTRLEQLARDASYGLRQIRRNPGFSAIAIATLALGIGASTAIFSVVDAILLRPLPYPEPDRLVRIWESPPTHDRPHNLVNPLNFLDWRDHSQSFEAMAAVLERPTNVSVNGQPLALPGLQVSPDFFSILRVAPVLGRTFVSEDGVPGHDGIVILSHGFWQRQFGANPAAVGQRIEVDGVPLTIVGVMPQGFSFPNVKPEVWMPMALDRSAERSGGRFLTVVARLKPGVTLDRARQDMRNVTKFTAESRPEQNKDWGANVFPMLEDATQDVRRPLWVLLASVGFLLLIACANVANLLLMRGTARLREIAVRTALGAARARIVQQLLAESLVLSVAGMAAGLVLAHFGLRGLLALIPQNAPLPRSEPISIDERVFLFTLLAAVLTAVLFGLVPALRLSRLDVQKSLAQGTLRGGVGGHVALRRSFVVAEVALALLLSVGAGLMLRSFARLMAVDPGFAPNHLVTMRIWTSPSRYTDNLKRSQYVDNILNEIRQTPGVEAASSIHFLPLTERISGSCFSPADQPPPSPAEAPDAQFLIVGSDYFRTMGTPVLSGREFETRDHFNGPPVAVVNDAFVRRFSPKENILGKQLRVCWTIQKPVEVVGVVADARQAALQKPPEPTIFLCNSQAPMYFASLVVRAQGDARQILREAELAVHRVDPEQAVSDLQTMDSVFSDSVSAPRLQLVLLLVFAGIALALATIGVYGVVSYSVGQRTQEIGIRVALGARAADVARMVLQEALLLAGLAVVLGLSGAFALTRLLQSLLFAVKPTDPATLAAVSAAVLAVAVIAAFLPARRASRVDPVIALRNE